MHIVVIGGGVIGTTTAFWLAREGHAVTLIERQPELAAEGSFANGGMLHASHGEPWNSPQAVRQLLAWIGREDSPLLLRPSRLPQLLRWGTHFLRNSTAARHCAATLANTRLARYSQAAMAMIRSEVDIQNDSSQAGIAKIFWDTAELDAATRWSDLLQEIGVPYQRWSTDELISREPALAACGKRLAGALYYPDDATGDTCSFTRQLGAHCQQLGVAVRTATTAERLQHNGMRIAAVITDSGPVEADQFVLASGPEAPRLLRPLGLRLPIEPVKGYSVTIDTRGIDDLPRLALIDDHHKIVATPLGARLRVAGTAEFVGFDTRINPHRVQLLLTQLNSMLPLRGGALAAAPRTEWACLRPMTPDGIPIIGPTQFDNLWLNAGAGHMGWTFAAGMGRMLTDLIAGRQPELAATAYSFDRWL